MYTHEDTTTSEQILFLFKNHQHFVSHCQLQAAKLKTKPTKMLNTFNFQIHLLFEDRSPGVTEDQINKVWLNYSHVSYNTGFFDVLFTRRHNTNSGARQGAGHMIH